MTSLDNLIVRPGQEVTAALWNRLVAAVRARQIVRGYGTRVSPAPYGTTISILPPPGFSHAWLTTVARVPGTDRREAPAVAYVAPGTVNGVDPLVIDDRKLSELDPSEPAVELMPQNFDTRDRCFIALQVEMSKGYSQIDTARIVQCANLTSNGNTARADSFGWERGIVGFSDSNDSDKHYGRFPLARIQKQGDVLIAFQVAHWNLQHAAVPPQTDPGSKSFTKLARHFFWPAA